MINSKSPSKTSRPRCLAAWLLGAFLLAANIDRAKGQTFRSDAICNSTSWIWSFNSKQQSPCLVAGYLLAPCSDGLPALGPNQVYTPPTQALANMCRCSTVSYSVISACGLCQTGLTVSWSSWRANCTNSMTSISTYPNQVNSTTAVPAWAYLDVVTPDTFDPARAKQATNLPESTAGNLVSTSSSTSPLAAPSGTSTLKSNNKSNNTLAIIGGSVGGALGLGLIVLLILYLLKRGSIKRIRRRPTTDLLSSPVVIMSAEQSMDTSGSAATGFYYPQNGHATHP